MQIVAPIELDVFTGLRKMEMHSIPMFDIKQTQLGLASPFEAFSESQYPKTLNLFPKDFQRQFFLDL